MFTIRLAIAKALFSLAARIRPKSWESRIGYEFLLARGRDGVIIIADFESEVSRFIFNLTPDEALLMGTKLADLAAVGLETLPEDPGGYEEEEE